MIRVYDTAGNVMKVPEHECDFKKWRPAPILKSSAFLTVSARFYTFWIFYVVADFS